MNELLKTLLSLSVSGSLLILLLFVCKRLFKDKVSKGWQYYIWLIVILRLLLPFALDTNLVGTIFQQIGTHAARGEMAPPAEWTTPETGASEADIQSSEQASSLERPPDSKTPVIANLMNLAVQNIGFIWLITALSLLIRKITIYQSFVKYIRAGWVEVSSLEVWEQLGELAAQIGVKRPVALYTNSLITSPLLVGFWKPCIMLPTTALTQMDLRYILRHELIHCRRQDMLYKWLVQAAVCLHWFNPAVHLMGREISRACELACDEAVIRDLNEKEKSAYGNTLLEAIQSGGRYQDSLASACLNGSVALLKERLESIMNYKKKSKLVSCLTFILTFTLCIGSAAMGAYAAPVQENLVKTEITKTNGVTTIPVNIKSIPDGQYAWLGEYTLSAGDKIQYNIPTATGYRIAVGFVRSPDLSPTYFTQMNNKSHDILQVIGGFEVSPELAGRYQLFIQACDGKLENINGTIRLGKLADTSTAPRQNTIIVPAEAAAIKKNEFLWLGEYTLSHGDKLHYNVSAAAGNGLQVGLAAPGDDPLNRTYYTSSTMRYNGILEVNTDFTFSAPVTPGRYKLFVRSSGSDTVTNVTGSVTITKPAGQAPKLQTITIKDKTYYMIETEEQLRALAAGQFSLDHFYVLQCDINLSDAEWVPIGTAENPFTGSFSGNGFEIKGLTMKNPNAGIIGLFGVADGANIHNITLRDYDISTAGKNTAGKHVAPILALGLNNTRCYDNFVYPKK